MGQLTREDNLPLNKTYVYTYDNAGNILTKKVYAFTTSSSLGTAQQTITYTYSGDRLIDYNDGTSLVDTQGVHYDTIGNPLIIGNGSTASNSWMYGKYLTWKGGELTKIENFEMASNSGVILPLDSITFTYNADGIRTSKTVAGVKHTYILSGSQILVETWTQSGVEHTLQYVYDELGAPVGLKYRRSTQAAGAYQCFFFERNLQGDIVAIYNESGTKICSYTYDAWGVCTTTVTSGVTTLERSIANTYNPFRYRGYFYDVESGYYYLQSRYYNPTWGRFLNADRVISGASGTLYGNNLFVYCFNNPIGMVDTSGNWPEWIEKATNWVDKNIIHPVETFFNDLHHDLKIFDIKNDDEQKVLQSKIFSIYKGVPVFRIGGDRSGSFGAIFLTHETNSRTNPEDVVRHEFGHTKQLKELGLIKYALCIGLPSWQEWGSGSYYSKPWEVTADKYGGVTSRTHSSSDVDAGEKYLQISKYIGPLVWLFIK